MERLPVRLGKEPLIEAVWEIRFSQTRTPVCDLLPGFLFKSFPDAYRNVVRLPAADVPPPIANADPGLRYAPRIRLENGMQAVQIGDFAVSLSCRRPYPGWAQFSDSVRRLAMTVRESGLVDELDRFSLKYIDLIELSPAAGLACLNLELRLGGTELIQRPVHLRTEIQEPALFHIVQVVSPAEVLLPGGTERRRGVVVDIDTIKVLSGDRTWDDLDRCLDEVHLACKRMFFRLLAADALQRLEPEYGE